MRGNETNLSLVRKREEKVEICLLDKIMKALCIGNVAYDFTMPMENYPKENMKYRVENAVSCGGGPASNAAYLLSLWGVNTYFGGVIGYDDNG